jgi:hypothetical protein
MTKQPIRKILIQTQSHWDTDSTRPSVRQAFRKAIECRTFALGALLFASENDQLLIPCTCKSPACPSCGLRNTVQWQREQWAALPELPYKAITLTMPDVLWPLFQHNRELLDRLHLLGAKLIENWAKEKYGVRLLIIVVPHSFSRHLTFNPHLHCIVSVLGLRESDCRLVPAFFNRQCLMRRWRLTVIRFLREALKNGALVTDVGGKELETMLTAQSERWWSVHVTYPKSKTKLLRYVGRYVRRPPIAEHRFIEINEKWVVFWTEDLKLGQRVLVRYSPEEFVDLLAEHVPDRYRHGVHHYGVLSPRAKNRSMALIFALSAQIRRPRPQRLSYAQLLKRTFNRPDPFIDSKGHRMYLVRRIRPEEVRHLRLQRVSDVDVNSVIRGDGWQRRA